jgi:PAS domain S-box-containing protein
MVTKQDMFIADNEKLPELIQTAMIDQIKWLIKLRWFAVVGILVAGVVCTRLFPVLSSAGELHVCAGILLACNLVYSFIVSRRVGKPNLSDSIHTLIQIEIDLLMLTALIHFGGGIINPFILFYAFHIIIATIVLSKTLSFVVSMSAIVMFGIMALGELNGWPGLEHHSIELKTEVYLWKNHVYMFGAFFAFTATVVLTQYLTRTVVARMTSKEIEAARNRDLLEAMIAAMGEGLLFINNEGKIAMSNPEAVKWASGEKETIRDFPKPLVDHVTGLMAEATSVGPACQTVKFDFAGEDSKKRYVEAKSCPVMDEDGSRLGFVIVGQDITEHKHLEQELRTQTDETSHINEMLKMSRVEMAHREKMVAIGQMATGIAHEIDNPLASLSSVIQYIARKSDGQQEQFDVMKHQIDRISVILRRMLSLSRPATSEYKWVDINTTIENTISLVRFDKRAKNVKFENVENKELPMVWLNPLHFEQVLLNITINALDAMSVKETEDEHLLTVSRSFADGKIEVRISDTGIGMEKEVCRRAFESFFTTKELGKGTGLGLFISYNLITEVDGTISMDSEPGKGTTVTISVPVRPKNYLISDDEDSDVLQERAS